MDDSTKKMVMVGIIIVCFIAAGAIFFGTRSKPGGIPSEFAHEKMWIKCTNPECGQPREVTKKEYYEFIRENMKGDQTPPMPCNACGKETCYIAEQCKKCGNIFLYGSGDPGDYKDRCPKCGYSDQEDQVKQRNAQRSKKQ